MWGLPESSVQKETMMVGHALKHYSAVDVTVVGEAITEEIPYKVSINNINPNPSFLDMLGIQFLGRGK